MNKDPLRRRVDERNALLANANNGSIKASLTMYLSCAVVLLGSVTIGTVYGVSSPMIHKIQTLSPASPLYMDATAVSWFGSSILIAAMLGSFLMGYFMQAIGRKLCITVLSLLFVAGFLLMTFATHVWMLMLGRVFTGFLIGMSTVVILTYIGEISTPDVRGLLGSFNHLGIVLGIMYTYSLGSTLSLRNIPLTPLATVVPMFLFSFFIPESPTFLLQKNRVESARICLTRLRSKYSDVDTEFRELKVALTHQEEQATWLEILRNRSLRIPVFLLFGAMYFCQMGGINCVVIYSSTIFAEAGFTSPSQLTVALMAISSTQVIFTLIMSLIIDKAGRRVLWVTGAIFMTIGLVLFGLYFPLKANLAASTSTNSSAGAIASSTASNLTEPPGQITPLSYLALISMVVFIAAYSFGIGPISWLLVGELIPARAKERASGMAISINYTLAFLLTLEFTNMVITFSPQGTFWFFAANCVLAIFFAVFLLPETKGRTLEEIEASFRK